MPPYRPLSSCPSQWHGFLPQRGLWWRTYDWVTLFSFALEAGFVCQIWRNPLLFLWSFSLRANFLPVSPMQELGHWRSSCKKHDRLTLSSPHFWSCLLDAPRCFSTFGTASCGGATSHSRVCLSHSLNVRYNDQLFVVCLLNPSFSVFSVLRCNLYDILFDLVDGPGKVATSIGRFCNMFFFLRLVILLCPYDIASLQQRSDDSYSLWFRGWWELKLRYWSVCLFLCTRSVINPSFRRWVSKSCVLFTCSTFSSPTTEANYRSVPLQATS